MDPRAERRRRIAQLESLLRLYTFASRAWSIVEPSPLLVDPRGLEFDVIHTVCMHLQAAIEGRLQAGNGRRLLVALPPGHGKSLNTSVFLPSWLWAWDPSWRMIFSSYDDKLVLRDAAKTRQIITSDWYQDTFVRGAWSLRRDLSGLWLFANTAHGFRQGVTVGGAATGHRGQLLGIDDPIKVRDIHKAPVRLGVIDWYGGTMSSRFIAPEEAVIICIMQRLHDEDLIGHLVRRGGFCLLQLQSILEEPCSTPIWTDPRKPGELLFPARYPARVIEEAKLDMGAMFAAQHQQKPVDVLASMFPRSAWRFWKHKDDPDRSGNRPWGCDTGPAMELPKLDREILTVDCGYSSQKSDSDRTAMHRWGAAGANRFLLDRRTRRRTFSEMKRDFGEFAREHPRYDFALVERKASGVALVDEMRGVVPRLNPENYTALVYPQDGKDVRALAWSPALRAGNVYLYEGMNAKDLEELVAEFERFPRGGGHDDDVDAASLGMNALREAGIEASAALCDLPSRMVWGGR